MAVILDIGEVFTKCGLSGDAHPAHVLRSNFSTLAGRKVRGVGGGACVAARVRRCVLVLACP